MQNQEPPEPFKSSMVDLCEPFRPSGGVKFIAMGEVWGQSEAEMVLNVGANHRPKRLLFSIRVNRYRDGVIEVFWRF